MMALRERKAPGALGDGEEDRPTVTVYAPAESHSRRELR